MRPRSVEERIEHRVFADVLDAVRMVEASEGRISSRKTHICSLVAAVVELLERGDDLVLREALGEA